MIDSFLNIYERPARSGLEKAIDFILTPVSIFCGRHYSVHTHDNGELEFQREAFKLIRLVEAVVFCILIKLAVVYYPIAASLSTAALFGTAALLKAFYPPCQRIHAEFHSNLDDQLLDRFMANVEALFKNRKARPKAKPFDQNNQAALAKESLKRWLPRPEQPEATIAPVAQSCAVCLDDISDKLKTLNQKLSTAAGEEETQQQIALNELFFLECSHIFHMDCIKPWGTMRQHSCPLCREPSDELLCLFPAENNNLPANNVADNPNEIVFPSIRFFDLTFGRLFAQEPRVLVLMRITIFREPEQNRVRVVHPPV